MQQIVSYAQHHEHVSLPIQQARAARQAVVVQLFQWRPRGLIVVTDDAPVDSKRIFSHPHFVLSGDTLDFTPEDADKDDYTQNCVGGPANGMPWEEWQAHNKGQNVFSSTAMPNGIKATTPTK